MYEDAHIINGILHVLVQVFEMLIVEKDKQLGGDYAALISPTLWICNIL